MKREFNLIDEPWIRVLTSGFETKEVSLRTFFEKANEYRAFAGETEAQDVAILRFLLAIAYSVFARYHADGEPGEFEEEDDALERWQELWERESFPMVPIAKYFEDYYDRFWLFDEERPFYQVNEAKVGTYASAAKLNGAIAESNNKARMFSERAGDQKNRLTFSEAARWLIYLNGFDDTSSKESKESKKKGLALPSISTGWLGQLGIVFVEGEHLYQTVLLNLCFLKDGKELWEPVRIEHGKCATWELPESRKGERISTPVPQNLAALYTFQSRRIYLKRSENSNIIGYYILGGDIFEKTNAINEQMTIWSKKQDKNITFFTPKQHDSTKRLWREFPSVVKNDEKNNCPGIMNWISVLYGTKLLSEEIPVRIKMVSVEYEKRQKSSVTDSFDDGLSFHAHLLLKSGGIWQNWIENEIVLCELCAWEIRNLSVNLRKAAGDSGEISEGGFREIFYSWIDPVFRKWLANLEPEKHGQEYIEELRDAVRNTAYRLGRKMVEGIAEKAITGCWHSEKKNGKEDRRHYSVPEAYNYFRYRIKKIYEGS